MGIWLRPGCLSRIALKASAKRCSFCRENFIAGVEMHGAWVIKRGLRITRDFTLSGACGGLESSLRLDAARLARFWVERQQQSLSSALGRIAGNYRLWLYGQSNVWGATDESFEREDERHLTVLAALRPS